jgi:hypothetical protein
VGLQENVNLDGAAGNLHGLHSNRRCFFCVADFEGV